MSDLLNDKTTAEWAALNPGRTGLLNKMHETLSALLAHRLREAEEQLMALGMGKDIGLDRSEIEPVPMDDPQMRRNKRPAAEALEESSSPRVAASPTKQQKSRTGAPFRRAPEGYGFVDSRTGQLKVPTTDNTGD